MFKETGLTSNLNMEKSYINNLENGSSKDESAFWSESESLALISVYGSHTEDFKHARKRKLVWHTISDELSSLGYNRSATKCERKWLNMVRVYKQKKEELLKTGRGSSFKYFEKLDELLGDRSTNCSTLTVEESYVNNLESGSSNDEAAFWSESESLALISSYGSHIEDFKHARKRKMVWHTISEELMSLGYNKSATKCERKWLNMVRVYKQKKDELLKTGRGPSSSFKYFEKLDELLGNRPSNCVNTTMEESYVEFPEENTTSNNDLEESQESKPFSDIEDTSVKKKPKLNLSTKMDYFKMKLEAKKKEMQRKEERHRELIALEKERLALERKKIEALEKYLESRNNIGTESFLLMSNTR